MKKLLASLFALAVILSPVTVFAAAETVCTTSGDNSAVGQALNSASQAGDDCNERSVTNTAAKATNLLSWVVGIAAIVAILVAGFKYITAAGDANRISSAKSAIVYAVVGLAIVALAQFIVHFTVKETEGGLKNSSSSATP